MMVDVCQINKNINIKYARICSDHFQEDDYLLKQRFLELPFQKLRLIQERSKRSGKINFSENNNTEEEKNNNYMANEIIIEPNCNIHEIGKQTMLNKQNMQEIKICELEKEVRELKSKLNKQTQQSKKATAAYKNLRRFFTKGQVKKLQSTNQKIKWSIEDISSALSPHSTGSRSYRYLYNKGYLLPATCT